MEAGVMLPMYFFLYKLRFLFSGILIVIAALLLISAAVPQPTTAQAGTAHSSNDLAAIDVSDSPNAVTRTMIVAGYQIKQTTEGMIRTTGSGLQTAGAAISKTSSSIARATQAGTTIVFRGIGNGIMFVVRIPGHIIGFISPTSAVNAVIKPADHNPVPIINPRSPALVAAKEALPAKAAPEVPIEAVWPMHGQITTPFGVPEWPYQAVHTGLDISDGQSAGTTPINAFRKGKVITAERSGGLGNHVVIDHGSGVTSVYGHFASITVQIGQMVDVTTILGYEGSTGVSTGPHLHFEIRVDGQATDPHQFISGQPY
jgi:murein DD-endopeptidase MepM/ murein hydrolase activator NlpD